MALWALVRSDGFQLLRDPPDTTRLRPVTENKPALSAGQRYDGYTAVVGPNSVQLTYTVMAIAAIDANGDLLRQKAQAALAVNVSYLALGAPTTAQLTAQVATLTKECSAVIRLALGLLDDTSGT